MVRSVAQRRVSNHGPLAPLSPVARPSRRRCAPPQDEVEGYCRPHGEERRVATRLEPWAAWHRSRPWPILRDARPPISGLPEIGGRAPQDEVDRRTRLRRTRLRDYAAL